MIEEEEGGGRAEEGGGEWLEEGKYNWSRIARGEHSSGESISVMGITTRGRATGRGWGEKKFHRSRMDCEGEEEEARLCL